VPLNEISLFSDLLEESVYYLWDRNDLILFIVDEEVHRINEIN